MYMFSGGKPPPYWTNGHALTFLWKALKEKIVASPKAIQFENDMLAHVGELKRLVLAHIDDSDARQKFQVEINALYDRAHLESRNLRKSLAHLHARLDGEEPEWDPTDGNNPDS